MNHLKTFIGLLIISVVVIELCAALKGTSYINWGQPRILPTIFGYFGIM